MIAVVRYGAGNVRSVLSAMRRLGYDGVLTDDPEAIRSADKVIFPGVGEASSAMALLREKGLDEVLSSLEQPFLGICLGMQLMCSFSEEGGTEGLGIFPESVRLFPKGNGVKIPHMGWNSIENPRGALFDGISGESYFYFVHSYYVPLSPYTAAECTYDGITFSAALAKGNYLGTQFHPEKSGSAGERVLSSFLEAI